jgi:formate dehydrogenase iron-sulfur subunit
VPTPAELYLDAPGSAAARLPLLDRELELVSIDSRPTVQLRQPAPLIPERPLRAGEQYRFHFDMTKCIGCKCCVVACNEQNGNPAAIHWRRVGEVEGGFYPYTQRYHLSMGCNHCLEPSCLIGCPVEAYTKDPATGVVLHSADACIGCQYCTWNCSYGVPQYNRERGVVGKCDMCHHRLADGMAPACAAACPESAIAIEIVDIAAWRREHAAADAPGLPSADDSISTTRVTVPADLAPDMGRVDTQRIQPEHPHWALVFLLVLTQLSVGAFAVLWVLDLLGGGAALTPSALVSFGIAAFSLAAAPLHLGRPIYAFRALRGLRHSWLSREVLGLSLFAGAAAAYAGMLLLGLPMRPLAGVLTVALGAAGIACSAMIYVVRARPAWFSKYTAAEFFSTALLLGPLFARAMGVADAPWTTGAAAAGGAAQLLTQGLKFLWLAQSDVFELRASSLLLAGRLRRAFLTRLSLLVAAIALSLIAASGWEAAGVLVLALAGEWLGRWLFFVSVVPKNMAAAFTAPGKAAA